MIVSIKGKIVEMAPFQVVIDVQGIGYAVNVPLTTTEVLPGLGNEVFLYTWVVYREDSQALYGFRNREERDFFQLLIEKVSGVGPKIALGIMSKLSLRVLKDAIVREDVGLLSQCPGIGKKMAERLALELRDKFCGVGNSGGGQRDSSEGMVAFRATEGVYIQEDAVAALVKLGLNPATADKSVRRAFLEFKEEAPSVEELVKRALG